MTETSQLNQIISACYVADPAFTHIFSLPGQVQYELVKAYCKEYAQPFHICLFPGGVGSGGLCSVYTGMDRAWWDSFLAVVTAAQRRTAAEESYNRYMAHMDHIDSLDAQVRGLEDIAFNPEQPYTEMKRITPMRRSKPFKTWDAESLHFDDLERARDMQKSCSIGVF